MNPNESIEGNAQSMQEQGLQNKAKSPLYQSISFEQLLKGRSYCMIGNQMLFEKEGVYYLTTIDYNKTYTAIEYAELPEDAPFQLVQGKLVYMASPKDIVSSQ